MPSLPSNSSCGVIHTVSKPNNNQFCRCRGLSQLASLRGRSEVTLREKQTLPLSSCSCMPLPGIVVSINLTCWQ
jgi:hypothetical protein